MQCSLCSRPIEEDSVASNEDVAWCPNCRRVFHVPYFRVPAWILGVIALLIIKVQAGL